MKKSKEYMRSTSDFSEPGIILKDVTSILQDVDGPHLVADSLIHMAEDLGYDVVIGPKSGGSIFGVPIAHAQYKSFVLVHKWGKFPCETIPTGYELEYGTAIIKTHRDVIKPGQRVAIVDDLIVTRGTTEAIIKLVE